MCDRGMLRQWCVEGTSVWEVGGMCVCAREMLKSAPGTGFVGGRISLRSASVCAADAVSACLRTYQHAASV